MAAQRMEYEFITLHEALVEDHLERKAAQGWRVHTFAPGRGIPTVSILLEREKPLTVAEIDRRRRAEAYG